MLPSLSVIKGIGEGGLYCPGSGKVSVGIGDAFLAVAGLLHGRNGGAGLAYCRSCRSLGGSEVGHGILRGSRILGILKVGVGGMGILQYLGSKTRNLSAVLRDFFCRPRRRLSVGKYLLGRRVKGIHGSLKGIFSIIGFSLNGRSVAACRPRRRLSVG